MRRTASRARGPQVFDSDEALNGGDSTGAEVELLQGQLRALELPWEKVLEALEEDLLSVVGLCWEQSVTADLSPEGLALDFVFEPMHNEAKVSEVRFREESLVKPPELRECVEALASIGPVPVELADGLPDGIFTLRVGTDRAAADE